MKKILSPLFDFSAFLFPIVLVFYLILFLLENVFPGFVSNNFDLNYFLIPAIVFGFLAAFSNQPPARNASQSEAGGSATSHQEDKPATRGDFILIAGLTILSFAILVYKTSDLGLMGFVVSLIGSILILLVSLVLIVFPDMDKPQMQTENEIDRKYNFRKLFLSPLGMSLISFVLILIGGGLIYSLYFRGPSRSPATSNQQSVVRIEQPRVEVPDPELLEKTQIIVQNGSGVPGKAASVAAFLRDFSFGAVKTGDANNSNYKNAYLRFNLEDLKVASYMTFLLSDNDKYKIINMLPPINASQSGIILIIGQ